MQNLIERILGKKNLSAESLQAEAAKAEHAEELAISNEDCAEAAYETSLLAIDPAETKRAKVALEDAREARERATAFRIALRAQFLDACERESQHERRLKRESTQKAIQEAVDAIINDYPKYAIPIRNILGKIAATEAAVEEFNRDQPEGTERLVGPEAIARAVLGEPEEVLTEKVVDRWVYENTSAVLDDETAARVVNHGDGRGVLRGDFISTPVIRRKVREIRIREARARVWLRPLVTSVMLPGVGAADPPIWAPTESADPHTVRREIERLSAAPKHIEREREVRVEYRPIEAETIADAASTDDRAA